MRFRRPTKKPQGFRCPTCERLVTVLLGYAHWVLHCETYHNKTGSAL